MLENFKPIPFFEDPTKSAEELEQERKKHEAMNLKIQQEEAAKAQTRRQAERLKKKYQKKAEERNKSGGDADIEIDNDELEMQKIYEDFGIEEDDLEEESKSGAELGKEGEDDLSGLSSDQRIKYIQSLKRNKAMKDSSARSDLVGMQGIGVNSREQIKTKGGKNITTKKYPLPIAGSYPKKPKIIKSSRVNYLNKDQEEINLSQKEKDRSVFNLDLEKQKQVRDILDKFFDNPEFLAKIFNDSEIKVHHSEKEPGILFEFQGAKNKPVFLSANTKVENEKNRRENRIKWMKNSLERTFGNKEKNIIYANLILPENKLEDLRSTAESGELKEDLARTLKNDLENQMAVVALVKVRKELENLKKESKKEKEVDDYFKNYEEKFKTDLTYSKTDFGSAFNEFKDHINSNFLEIKNDPVINNVFMIMDRLKVKEQQQQEEEKVANKAS